MFLQLANAEGVGSSAFRYSDHRDMPPSTSLLLNDMWAIYLPYVEEDSFPVFNCDQSTDA
jgi:hypothetical protein